MNKVIFKEDLFTVEQNIIICTDEKTYTFRTDAFRAAEDIVSSCYRHGIFSVSLFGHNGHLKNLVEGIKKFEVLNYGETQKIEIEVNR